jgi:hypothetical protein
MKEDDGAITKDNVHLLKYGHGYSERPFKASQCAGEAADRSTRWITWHQCNRKPGFGTDGLFCKQHAKVEQSQIKTGYRIFAQNYEDYSIKEIEIEKINDISVWVIENGQSRRELRNGSYYIYFETKEAALAKLKFRAELEIKKAEKKTAIAKHFLESLTKQPT